MRRLPADIRVYRIPGRPCLYALDYVVEKRCWMKRSTGHRTEAAAMRKAREWRHEGERIESGELPSTAVHRRKSLREHVDDFLAMKRTDPRQLAPKSIEDIATCLNRVVAASGWSTLSAVTIDGLQEVLAGLNEEETDPGKRRRGRRPKGGRLSNGRLNHYRAHWKALTKWAHRTGRLDADPLASMNRWRTDGEETMHRLPLKVEEFDLLLRSTMERGASSERRAGTGMDRAMAYLLAASTGMRLGEVASVTVGAFSLDGELAKVRLQARSAKNRKTVMQPILPDAVEHLRRWLAGRQRDERPFAWLAEVEAARMVRDDAEAAGVRTTDEDGRILDFHALRHSYGTWLTTVLNVRPKEAQQLMRHSTMDLTMKLYTHLDDSDLQRRIGGGVGISRCAGAAPSAHTTEDHRGTRVMQSGAQSDDVRTHVASPAEPSESVRVDCEAGNERPPDDPGAGGMAEVAVGFEPTNNGFATRRDSDSKSVTGNEMSVCAEAGVTPALRGTDSDAADDDQRTRRAGRRRSLRERADAGEPAPSPDHVTANLLAGLRLLGVAR